MNRDPESSQVSGNVGAPGATQNPEELPSTHGFGAPWEVADLPEPPPFSLRNTFRVIGPGAILLASAIGGGEWLVGPAQAVEHTVALFWIVTLAIFFQLIFNLEGVRYTLYTGEPIYGGILRLWPGPKFWSIFYSVGGFLQIAWPALPLLGASTLFSAVSGRLAAEGEAGAGDARTLQFIAVGLIALGVAILQFGGTIERMLEYVSWFMLAFIFLFLFFVNVWFVPFDKWIATLEGFLGMAGGAGGAIDWTLLGALAATAGSGGLGNFTITNWIRDKGFGMGALAGAIPSAVGSRRVRLSSTGIVFPANERNLARWRVWTRYVHVDQIFVWAIFCFIGMFLNVNLVMGMDIPPGTKFTGLGAGAYQAYYLADKLWPGFWFLTLLNGFWILFSTQLGNTDILVRTVTDISWLASSRVRAWRGGDVRAVYYTILFALAVWGLIALWWGKGAAMFQLLANMAGLLLAIGGVQIFIVNRRFLPRAVRPPLWREVLLLASSAFYGFFTYQWLSGLI